MKTSKRGIVIADTVFLKQNDTSRLVYSSPIIKPLDLRRYLLYWDEIEWVTINQRNIMQSPELNLLIDEGIFKGSFLPVYTIQGAPENNVWYKIAHAQESVFRENNQRPNELWSLGKVLTNQVIREEEITRQTGLEISLVNALPIVPSEVPIEDILKFKQRRKDELLRFRVALGTLYEEIINTSDIHHSNLQSTDEIALALNDLHKVMGESFLKKIVSSLKVELNILDVLTGVGTAIGLSQIYNLPPALTIIVGGLVPALKITLGNIAKPKGIPEKLRDYSYLYYIETDLNKKRRHRRKR